MQFEKPLPTDTWPETREANTSKVRQPQNKIGRAASEEIYFIHHTAREYFMEEGSQFLRNARRASDEWHPASSLAKARIAELSHLDGLAEDVATCRFWLPEEILNFIVRAEIESGKPQPKLLKDLHRACNNIIRESQHKVELYLPQKPTVPVAYTHWMKLYSSTAIDLPGICAFWGMSQSVAKLAAEGYESLDYLLICAVEGYCAWKMPVDEPLALTSLANDNNTTLLALLHAGADPNSRFQVPSKPLSEDRTNEKGISESIHESRSHNTGCSPWALLLHNLALYEWTLKHSIEALPSFSDHCLSQHVDNRSIWMSLLCAFIEHGE